MNTNTIKKTAAIAAKGIRRPNPPPREEPKPRRQKGVGFADSRKFIFLNSVTRFIFILLERAGEGASEPKARCILRTISCNSRTSLFSDWLFSASAGPMFPSQRSSVNDAKLFVNSSFGSGESLVSQSMSDILISHYCPQSVHCPAVK